MNEKSQAAPEAIELGNAEEVTNGDPTPAHLEANPHIMGTPEA